MIATLDHTEDVGRHIRTFWFRPERALRYDAGQYTELYLPHDNPDDRGERRWFTLSSSPTDRPLVSITTKFADENGSTFKETLRNLTPGTQVTLAEAIGDFVLPKDKSIPLLFVAGGMGITPMHSMVKFLLDTDEQRTIQLLYAVHSDSQLIFRELFDVYSEKHGMKSTFLVEEPSADWRGETGRITPERVVATLADIAEGEKTEKPLVYLSGPKPLIEALSEEVKKQGIAEHHIVTDFFPGYDQF